MQTCPNCKHLNRIGVVFCDNCGASLIGDAPLATRSIASKLLEPMVEVPVGKGTEVFGSGAQLRLELEGADPIVLKSKREIILGRRDPATGAMPDVDFTPFAGYRMGISRNHAAIRQADSETLELWDLGSSNGTYLNGVRLVAHRPNRLRDGDEIRLGQMVIKIRFIQPSQTASTASSDGRS